MSAIARPALRYHGGKFRLAPKLLHIFPEHRVYTEAFGGAASVLLLKPRCHAEIYNDLDGEIVNVFRVLQDRTSAAELERMLRVTPFAREEFELSYKRGGSPIERARRCIIRSFMGFGSDSISRLKASRAGFNTRLSSAKGTGFRFHMRTGFRWNSNQSGTTPATDWSHYPNYIGAFTERLTGVVIEKRDAKVILEKMDRPETLHYVDPPYPSDVRRITGGKLVEHRYKFEMTDRQHTDLSETLHKLHGMVIISSYRGELYERLYHGWKTLDWTSPQFCGTTNTGDTMRTECIWLNEAAWSAMPTRRLW